MFEFRHVSVPHRHTAHRRTALTMVSAMLVIATSVALEQGACGSPAAAAEETNMADTTDAPADDHKVLRHAVFFKFKASASPEDIQGVVDAFAALPSKIDTIIDFRWGTNNSPEGLNDGLTHCFLLTFQDEAGRAVYLPHDDHKAFGDVLGPHMEDVFVVDYWGTAQDLKLNRELKHAVFLKFKDGATDEQIAAIERAFAALPAEINAIKAFEWGTNNSPEKHADGFTHCFMVTFASKEGREVYLSHRAHKSLGSRLQPILEQVRVLDFFEESQP